MILLARSQDKLRQVAQQVESNGAKSHIIQFDFASASDEDWKNLEKELASFTIAVLVNNVGVNVSLPTSFLEMEQEKIHQIVQVNIVATQKITRIVVPKMVERKKGVVLFLSSGGGVLSPAPYLSVYSGTKAYENALATALAGELASCGIIVQSVTPFFIASEMSKVVYGCFLCVYRRLTSCDRFASLVWQFLQQKDLLVIVCKVLDMKFVPILTGFMNVLRYSFLIYL